MLLLRARDAAKTVLRTNQTAQTFMLDDCYSLKERDKKGRIVEGGWLAAVNTPY
jgi:hypothetical protein